MRKISHPKARGLFSAIYERAAAASEITDPRISTRTISSLACLLVASGGIYRRSDDITCVRALIRIAQKDTIL